MAGPPADAAARAAALAQLRATFLAGLPVRWREISEAADARAREAALHRLAGAAGAYGLSELGDAARAAEQALTRGDGAAERQAMDVLRRHLADAGVTVR